MFAFDSLQFDQNMLENEIFIGGKININGKYFYYTMYLQIHLWSHQHPLGTELDLK